jgi:pimeloyl-ACP methyl ester carboxylesterase
MMTHGNAGQASQRGYVLPHLSGTDAFYVIEYPGYGSRPGSPSKDTMDRAALEGYRTLRKMFPHTPVGLIGESIGSGPASFVASTSPAPDKVVLVVPFDTLESVAAGQMPFLPVSLMLRDKWDNVGALRDYRGPIDIYAAVDDRVIPPEHAKRLAASLPHAKLTVISGGHNDWSSSPLVQISL